MSDRWMLDLFCGRLGWAREFARRGWHCVVIDLVEPESLPERCYFVKANVLAISSLAEICRRSGAPRFDFGCASSPCEKFAVWGMRHFHPQPAHPTEGIQLFEHARALFVESGILYVMENVRAAEKFVGRAVMRCGPFSLWGSGVPTLMPQGITKGFGRWTRAQILQTGSSKKPAKN